MLVISSVWACFVAPVARTASLRALIAVAVAAALASLAVFAQLLSYCCPPRGYEGSVLTTPSQSLHDCYRTGLEEAGCQEAA